MRRVAIVDIDTSHAWVLGNYVNADGRARVTHVVDTGLCWPRAHAERLARALGAVVSESVDELVGQIDGALFLAARYDNRLERAAPLLRAGLPLFFDKPAAGTVAQAQRFEALLREGYPLLCGSSMPYCPELRAIARVVQGGAPSALAVFGAREFFEHGIHAADVALSLVQGPARRVQWSTFGASELLWVELDAPTQLVLTLEAAANWCVAANGLSGNTVTRLNLDFHRDCHYARLMRAYIDLIEGCPVAFAPCWHLESIRLLIAGARSRELERPVRLDELLPTDGFDGRRYAEHYADRCRHSADPRGTLTPDAELFLVTPDLAGRGKLTRAERLRLRARDAAVHLLGQRGKRILKKVLCRA